MSLALAFTRTHRTAARLIACGVMCVLVICGVASARVALLGTNHVHQRAAEGAAMAGWTDFRRAVHVASGTPAHAHAHESLQRHHHDGGDASVVGLDAGAEAALAGEASNPPGVPVIELLAPGGRLADLLRAATTTRWPAAAARGIERLEASRLERPPRG